MMLINRLISIVLQNKLRLLFCLYLLTVYILALRPFYYSPACLHQEIHWLPGAGGIHSDTCSAVSSQAPPLPLYKAFKNQREISLEIRINTRTNEQWGPARIVSYSMDTDQRNFTIGQDHDALIFQLRTGGTDRNALNPHLKLRKIFKPGSKQHIMLTYDGKTETVYIDGRPARRFTFLKGRFSNWNPDCFLLIGNELTGNRPWKGDIFLFALYNRALSSEEVYRNYINTVQAGKKGRNNGRVTKGLAGLYDFSEGSGQWVNDKSKGKKAGSLGAAEYHNFYRIISADFMRNFYLLDMIINVLGFIPLSFLVYLNCRGGRKKWIYIYLAPLAVGFVTSFSIEYLQRYNLVRDANLWDLIYNVSGALAGSLMLHGWLWLKNRH